jgi:hypothetical protein
VAYNFQTGEIKTKNCLCATRGSHVEVVQHSVILILQIIKLFELHFHIL